MKNISRNIGLFMIAITAISIGGTYAITSNFVLEYGTPNPASVAAMTGHVEAIVYDESGSIIAYRQADNAIVNTGMDVLGDQLFLDCDSIKAGPGGCVANTNNHTNTTAGAFGWMTIGNQSLPGPDGDDERLQCPLLRADSGIVPGSWNCPAGGQPRNNCGSEFEAVWNTHPVKYLGGPSRINVTVVSTFDGADCSSRDIREAGMWNNETTLVGPPVGNMFARNTFGSVTLTTTDSLELTWRFTFTDN